MNYHPTVSGAPESPARLLVRLPLCDKTLSEEYANDFTLPDYLPEIRKMLRVTVTVLPPESYVSAAAVEFAGTLLYHILYTGADGELWSADLPAEASLAVPIDPSPACDLSMGVDAWADATPDLVATRVLSPRKLAIRTRLKVRARAYAYHSLEESLSGSPHGRIERLAGESDAAVLLRGHSEPMELGDEIIDTASDSLRILSAEGAVFVSEASAGEDRAVLRGEVCLKLLTAHDATSGPAADAPPSHPTVLRRKLPFTAEIAVEGADRTCDARGMGEVSKITVSAEDGRILVDVAVVLTAECQKNQRFSYTRDLFSTGAECEATYAETVFPYALRTENGNFTLSDAVPLDGSGVTKDDQILDAACDLTLDTVTEHHGKVALTGNARFHLLTVRTGSGEYGFGEFTVPFRYLAERAGDAKDLPTVSDHDAHLVCISVRVKSDGERLSVDAEIAVSLRTAGTTSAKRLTTARFGEPLKNARSGIVLAYPAPDSTLWETAKAYRSTVAALASRNALDPNPDAPLAGTRFLVVRE